MKVEVFALDQRLLSNVGFSNRSQSFMNFVLSRDTTKYGVSAYRIRLDHRRHGIDLRHTSRHIYLFALDIAVALDRDQAQTLRHLSS